MYINGLDYRLKCQIFIYILSCFHSQSQKHMYYYNIMNLQSSAKYGDSGSCREFEPASGKRFFEKFDANQSVVVLQAKLTIARIENRGKLTPREELTG